MLELEWVNPNNLHDWWPQIREGLEKVKKHGDNWLVEDVYLSIKHGQSNIHIGTVAGDYRGFLVTQQLQGYDGPILHIWACYSSDRKEADLLTLGMAYIEEWATNIKAKRITFHSPRKGWEKNTLGFKPVQIIYSKEVMT